MLELFFVFVKCMEFRLMKRQDIYYNSETADMIEEGVADLHCRSDKYLAEEIWREHQERK